MSTVAYRAALVREIEQTMRRLEVWSEGDFTDGQLDAYANILQLLRGDDLAEGLR